MATTAKSDIYSAYTEEELSKIAQLKRVFECVEGDPIIQKAITEQVCTAEMADRFKQIGVNFEMDELAFLWECFNEVNAYTLAKTYNVEDQLPESVLETIRKYPLMLFWGEFTDKIQGYYRCCHADVAADITTNNKLNAWRKRRIASGKSELGHFGRVIDHPLYAFELSAGCSVGCWFCSFATDHFRGMLDYNENKEYFSGIINNLVELFGQRGAGWALPYYRTEPHDNPDYIQYLKDFEEITGSPICTSTAVADVKWLKEMLEYYTPKRCPWPRVSVLTVGMLKKVHENFKPEELLYQQLLMQLKNHNRPKVTGGRILKQQDGIRNEVEEIDVEHTFVPQGSIACVSGFLINLIERTIDIISPCYTSEKWPYGYRVFDSATYEDEAGFTKVMNELIDRNMFDFPPSDKILSFREDIVYTETPEGFDLRTPNQIHHFKMKDTCGPLGALINEGLMTFAEIRYVLMDKHKLHPLVINASVQKLFDDGFISELYQ